MSDQLDVSVVIPTYNGGAFIAQALQSVLEQRLVPVEILVVDDRSKDNTLEVVNAVAASTEIPIRVIALDTNSGGPAKPMNIGIQAAKTPWIAMLDQDDLMTPIRLESSLLALQANSDASIACGNYRFIDQDGQQIENRCSQSIFPFLENSQYPQDGVLRCSGDVWFKRFFTDGGLQQSCSNHVFRKSLWESLGGYRETAGFASDYDFFIRGFRQGVVWVKPVVFEKRVHASNTWINNQESEIKMANLQDCLIEGLGHPEAYRWRNEVLVERARMARWKGHYKLSRMHAFRLLKHGIVFDSIKEILKSSLLEPVDAIRSLIKAKQ
jgi:glycosyltransferase involved in cell wall biosynthesis